MDQKIESYREMRSRSGPLPPGVAPPVSSDSFRMQPIGCKPRAKCWDQHLSIEGRGRHASTLKGSAAITAGEDVISLGTGRPAAEYCPWDSISMQSVSLDRCGAHNDAPERWSGSAEGKSNDVVGSIASDELMVSCSRGDAAYDLGVAMNYGYSAGSPQLLRFITEHVEMIHDPPYGDWETVLTCGTTAAIEMILRMLCNRGDWIVVEQYTYSGAIEATEQLGLNLLDVRMDDVGLLPADLDAKLSGWDASSPKPRVLYTIPSGHNPTGCTQTQERRRAIYWVAEQHDLIILEDDPYYLLQLGGNVPETALSLTMDAFISMLPPSYLSLDLSGRVIRLDTTSKILAPGFRCGWLTGCSQLVAKFLNHTEFSTVSPSGPSQVMLYKLLDDTWGHDGFIRWLIHLSSRYQERYMCMMDACHRYLPKQGICQWRTPSVGMFVWVRLDWRRHPAATGQYAQLGDRRGSFALVEEMIFSRAKESGVQVSKGSWFAVGDPPINDMYFRLTFAAAPKDALEVAVKRFGEALTAEFKSANGSPCTSFR